MAEAACDVVQQVVVEGLDEAQVIVGHRDASFGLDVGHGVGALHTDGTEGDERHVATVVQAASAAYGHGLEGAAPVGQTAAAAGVADDEGPLAGQLCGVHQAAQFALV